MVVTFALSPQKGTAATTSVKVEDLVKYDPGYWRGRKTPTLFFGNTSCTCDLLLDRTSHMIFILNCPNRAPKLFRVNTNSSQINILL